MKQILFILMLAAVAFADCIPWVAGAQDYHTGDCVTLNGATYVAQRDVNAWTSPSDTWFWATSISSSSSVVSSSSAVVVPPGKQTINLYLSQYTKSVFFVAPFDALVSVSYSYFVNSYGIPETTILPPFHATLYVADMTYGRPHSIVEAYLPVGEVKGNSISQPTVGPMMQGGVIPAGHRFGIWMMAPNYSDKGDYVFNAWANLTIEPVSALVAIPDTTAGQ